ncbi:MAG TPA: segregation/condensation protein A, partial [Noviherbaspirillum sp.]
MTVDSALAPDSIAAAAAHDDLPLARLYGEPLLKLPNDLYIPPDALEI